MHTSYVVSLFKGDEQVSEVKRRYTEFETLRRALRTKVPALHQMAKNVQKADFVLFFPSGNAPKKSDKAYLFFVFCQKHGHVIDMMHFPGATFFRKKKSSKVILLTLSLFIHIETPDHGRGGCSRMAVSPTANFNAPLPPLLLIACPQEAVWSLSLLLCLSAPTMIFLRFCAVGIGQSNAPGSHLPLLPPLLCLSPLTCYFLSLSRPAFPHRPLFSPSPPHLSLSLSSLSGWSLSLLLCLSVTATVVFFCFILLTGSPLAHFLLLRPKGRDGAGG